MVESSTGGSWSQRVDLQVNSPLEIAQRLLLDTVADYPEITALIVLAVGAGVAGAVRAAVLKLSQRIPGQIGQSLEGPLRTAATGLFWLLMLASVFLMLRVLGIENLALVLDALLEPLGRVLIAGVILGAGHLIGVAARDLVRRRQAATSSGLLARLVYGVVLALALVVSAGQLGLDVSFVGKLTLVAFATLFGSFGLAFALGSRQFVANLMARSELERYQVGDRLRIGDVEGNVVEVRSTVLVLATPDGTVSVPAARLGDTNVFRLSGRVA